MERPIRFSVLTVSDTCFNGTNQDVAGPELCKKIVSHFPNSEILFRGIVPDEKKEIEEKLIVWCLKECDVILTTGGTGCSTRDVTPEATKSVIEKELTGMTQVMLTKSLAVTDKAMLSRPVCGIRKKTLIINLPGSTKGSTECFSFVMSAIPHAVALIRDDLTRVSADHLVIQNIKSNNEEPSKVVVNNVASRDRKSTYKMEEVEEAQKIILKNSCPTSKIEEIPIENSLNRVLAEDIFAKDPLPPFRASIKDGYAVRANAGSGIRKIKSSFVAGDQPKNIPLGDDEAVRISTGAPIPNNADAVVQVEDTEVVEVSPDGNEEVKINLLVKPSVGLDIREIGSDIQANSKVLNTLDVISPGHIGVLATIGRTKVKVFRRCSIGVLSTGNELKSHHDTLESGQIRDSNKLAIISLLKQYSYEAHDCGIAKDNPNAIKNALYKAFISNDVIITSGGVSMGEFDLIKRVLFTDFGALIHFGRVNMKPGKPTTFATLQFRNERKIVFGLPGNPVSACVTTLLFVLPCIKEIEQRPNRMFPTIQSHVDRPIENNDGRPSYLRVKVKYSDGGFIATTTGNQTSSRINSLVGANGLLCVPGNYNYFSKSDTFRTILIGELLN